MYVERDILVCHYLEPHNYETNTVNAVQAIQCNLYTTMFKQEFGK